MQNSVVTKKKSLKRVATGAILFNTLVLLLLSVLVEMVLFIYPTLENYKREMNHEGAYAATLIGTEYLEKIFARVKETYYAAPEELRQNQYSEEYTNLLYPLVDDEFMAARKILTDCREQAQMENVFITFFDQENQRLVYVIDGNAKEHAFLPGMWISNQNGRIDPPETIRRTLRSSWFMRVGYGRASGWSATDYISIYDSNGNEMGFMTINVNINEFVRQIRMFLAIYIPAMIIVLVGMAFWVAGAVNKRLLTPINSLAGAARKYMAISKVDNSEKTEVFKNLDIDTQDEIEELWETMVDMEDDVAEALKQIRDVTAKQERINAELDLAKGIQAAVLPTNFEQVSGDSRFDLHASMRPAKEVGGDFYDFFAIDEDHLGLVIADVSGKGVPAALFMMVSKSLIKNRALQGGTPSEILQVVNDSLSADSINDMFVTVWLGILTISTGEVTAASAGHEYPFMTDESGRFVMYKDPHGIAVGAMEGAKYRDYSFTLSKGGRIFVYTDGVAEAQDENEEFFGTARILDSLNSCRGSSAEQLIENMKKAVDDYAGNAEQFDDITMLTITYNG